MDKYIKMLIIKLSKKCKVTLNHKMFYSDEKERIVNVFTLIINNGDDKYKTDLFSKRDVVSELMKWVDD